MVVDAASIVFITSVGICAACPTIIALVRLSNHRRAGRHHETSSMRRSKTIPASASPARSAVRAASRISAHGCQGGHGCEIHVPRAFPLTAACLRVQARQRWPRHSRHPSLSRPPIDHVHSPLHGLDAEPVQKLLEGLTFQASRIKRRQTAAMPITGL